MKWTVLIAVVLVATQVFALPGEPVRRLSTAEAVKKAKETPGFDEVMALRNDPKLKTDVLKRNQLLSKVSTILRLKLENVITLEVPVQANLARLTNISPLEVLSEIIRQTSIIGDSNSTAREKEIARLTVELMAKSSNEVSGVIEPGQAAPTPEKVKAIMEISNKIAAMQFGTTSAKFVEAYKAALREGKTTEQAVRIASKNKFSEKELRECQ